MSRRKMKYEISYGRGKPFGQSLLNNQIQTILISEIEMEPEKQTAMSESGTLGRCA